jgi:hypothetical protein
MDEIAFEENRSGRWNEILNLRSILVIVSMSCDNGNDLLCIAGFGCKTDLCWCIELEGPCRFMCTGIRLTFKSHLWELESVESANLVISTKFLLQPEPRFSVSPAVSTRLDFT